MDTPNNTSDMVQIQLVSGEIAVVDVIDADLNQFRWTRLKHANNDKHIYAQRTTRVKGSKYLHRLILSRILGFDLKSSDFVDHINGNGLDNRRANLRLATSSQNRRNSRAKQFNTLEFKGIVFIKANNCYEARICVNYKTIHLGCYETQLEAAIAYNHAALKHHGEFAHVNEIENWQNIYPIPRQMKTQK